MADSKMGDEIPKSVNDTEDVADVIVETLSWLLSSFKPSPASEVPVVVIENNDKDGCGTGGDSKDTTTSWVW